MPKHERRNARRRVVQLIVALPRNELAALDETLVAIRLHHRTPMTRSEMIGAFIEVAMQSGRDLSGADSAAGMTTLAAAIFQRR
jgi:hypothetical protein